MVEIQAIKHSKSKLEVGKVYSVTKEIASILVGKKFAKHIKDSKK